MLLLWKDRIEVTGHHVRVQGGDVRKKGGEGSKQPGCGARVLSTPGYCELYHCKGLWVEKQRF